VITKLGGWDNCGAFEVGERDALAHLFGDAGGEGGNASVDAHEEGVGRSPTLFVDGVVVFAIEFHGHGSARAQGVAADKVRQETTEMQLQGFSASFDSGVDVGGQDVSDAALGVAGGEGASCLVVKASICETRRARDWTGQWVLKMAPSWMTEPFVPFFWFVRLRVAASAERRRARPELSGRTWPFFQNFTSRLVHRWAVAGFDAGVFADAEEAAERSVGEVANGLGFGRLRLQAFGGTPTGDRDWDGKLGLWDWVSRSRFSQSSVQAPQRRFLSL
jgi:hypothetical protein